MDKKLGDKGMKKFLLLDVVIDNLENEINELFRQDLPEIEENLFFTYMSELSTYCQRIINCHNELSRFRIKSKRKKI